jgi:diadenosine tetraphosphate (Ap4A) HIT family hydrolase
MITKRIYKMKTVRKINPEDYILSVLSPEERLEAAFKITKEAFRKSTLTVKEIEKAVKKMRSQ